MCALDTTYQLLHPFLQHGWSQLRVAHSQVAHHHAGLAHDRQHAAAIRHHLDHNIQHTNLCSLGCNVGHAQCHVCHQAQCRLQDLLAAAVCAYALEHELQGPILSQQGLDTITVGQLAQRPQCGAHNVPPGQPRPQHIQDGHHTTIVLELLADLLVCRQLAYRLQYCGCCISITTARVPQNTQQHLECLMLLCQHTSILERAGSGWTVIVCCNN
mmetsp:Transcript_20935/g.45789  ORF Transcript_20935/g.45789 Transcript_20935/m.45789 type:complete len:214 (+) Transcript_20935:264-905(+)